MSSPASDAIARVACELEDEFATVAQDASARGFRAGVLHVLNELERNELTDEIAGDDALDDLARRLRREVRP